MKRTLAALLLAVMLPAAALAANEGRNYTGGRFNMDLNSNQTGYVKPIDGGQSSTATVETPPGTTTLQAPQQRTLRRAPQQATSVKPACANPPCGLQAQQRQTPELGADGLKAKQDAAEDKLDTMGDTNEEMQLKLQMYQERRAKSDAILSNTLKKNSDTQSGIISNMK